eukprot:scaffold1469_cov257-Pinguiococcus_pyrenoidosus.AAC.7
MARGREIVRVDPSCRITVRQLAELFVQHEPLPLLPRRVQVRRVILVQGRVRAVHDVHEGRCWRRRAGQSPCVERPEVRCLPMQRLRRIVALRQEVFFAGGRSRTRHAEVQVLRTKFSPVRLVLVHATVTPEVIPVIEGLAAARLWAAELPPAHVRHHVALQVILAGVLLVAALHRTGIVRAVRIVGLQVPPQSRWLIEGHPTRLAHEAPLGHGRRRLFPPPPAGQLTPTRLASRARQLVRSGQRRHEARRGLLRLVVDHGVEHPAYRSGPRRERATCNRRQELCDLRLCPALSPKQQQTLLFSSILY